MPRRPELAAAATDRQVSPASAERCVAGDAGLACARGEPPCGDGERCEESADECVSVCETNPDGDGDGQRSIACGGADCDDDDPNRYPGNTEVCDVADHDEDCDPSTFGVRDQDSDGFPDARCCNVDAEGVARCGDDCDDTRNVVRPGNTEACDTFDNDCDGAIDEGVSVTCYPDLDLDTYAPPSATGVVACTCPPSSTTRAPESGADCDDTREDVRPGGIELCDAAGADEDCDGSANPPDLCACADGETRACLAPGRCRAGVETCREGRFGLCSISPAFEVCNAEDDDCDGRTDEGVDLTCFPDGDGDTYAPAGAIGVIACVCASGTTTRAPERGTDCDDDRNDVRPGGTEVCDAAAADEDCDGLANPPDQCMCVEGQTRPCEAPGRCRAGIETCRDGRYGLCSISPALELCNGEDDDCDGSLDEGVLNSCWTDRDGDGFAPASATRTMACVCPAMTTTRRPGAGTTDCNDGNPSVYPTASEVCDAAMLDENCDGVANPPDQCMCVNGAMRSCPSQGRCASGSQTCVGGSWSACSISPTSEVCNGEDDDCDGTIDNGVLRTCWADPDRDGFAVVGAATSQECTCPPGTTARAPSGTGSIDCRGGDPTVYPGAPEQCDGIDSNCSNGGGVELAEDRDGDRHASPGAACSGGAFPKDDCNDSNALVHGGLAEICDGLDNDCSGVVDGTGVCQFGCQGLRRSGRAYAYCSVGTDWRTARDGCRAMGMELVRVDDASENTFVSTYSGGASLWLGGSDDAAEGQWRWMDGTLFWTGGAGGTPRVPYTHWASGQPNNDGDQDFMFMRSDGTWADGDAGGANRYVCEDY